MLTSIFTRINKVYAKLKWIQVWVKWFCNEDSDVYRISSVDVDCQQWYDFLPYIITTIFIILYDIAPRAPLYTPSMNIHFPVNRVCLDANAIVLYFISFHFHLVWHFTLATALKLCATFFESRIMTDICYLLLLLRLSFIYKVFQPICILFDWNYMP